MEDFGGRQKGRRVSRKREGVASARNDLPELAFALVGDDVQRAVRTLPHVAHALPAVAEKLLLARDAIVLERQSNELRVLEAADEEAAAPGGKRFSRVELRARRGDHRVPVIDGLLILGPCRRTADRQAGNTHAVGCRASRNLALLDRFLVTTAGPCSMIRAVPRGANAAD